MNAFQEKDREVWETLADPEKLAAFYAESHAASEKAAEEVRNRTAEDWDHFLHGTVDDAVADLIQALDERLANPASV